jgi:hypothetical protein
MHSFCSLPPSKHCKHRPTGGVAPVRLASCPRFPVRRTARGGGGRETLARRVHSIKHYPVTRSTGRFGLLGRRIRAPSSECRVLRRAIPGKFRATVNMA